MSSNKNSKIKTFLRMKPKTVKNSNIESNNFLSHIRMSKSPDSIIKQKQTMIKNLRRSVKTKPNCESTFNQTQRKHSFQFFIYTQIHLNYFFF